MLKNTSVEIFFISNLFEKKQTILDDKLEVKLNNFRHDQLLSVLIYNQNRLKLVTYSQFFILTKYKISHLRNHLASKVEFFKLIDSAIESAKFIYNRKCKYLYGTLVDPEKMFPKLKNFYEKKY